MPGSPPTFPELILRCAASAEDREAWRTLFSEHHAFVRNLAGQYLARAGIARQATIDADDVCMELWERLLREERAALRRFGSRSEGAFRSYLKKSVLRQVIDLKRRSGAKGRDMVHGMDPDQLAMIAASDGARGPLRELERRDLLEKARAHLRHCWIDSPTARRDFLIFAYHFETGLSAARISGVPSIGLSRGGVEKVIERIRVLLRELSETRSAEGGG